ncbi:MAG: hypothetical protein Q9220_000764 [cf. Caloplaca sp. 1 TL-2023]
MTSTIQATTSVPAVRLMAPDSISSSKIQLLQVSEITTKPVDSDVSDDDSILVKCENDSATSESESEGDTLEKLVEGDKQISSNKSNITMIPTPIVAEQEPPKADLDTGLAYDGKKPPVPRSTAQICEDIVRVLARYRLGQQNNSGKPWGAKGKFLEQVDTFVARRQPVLLSLPAFPFKSPNKATKVLGTLPDKGEEVALFHLQGLCLAIGDVYEPGAHVFIVSDGLVYNDILGVSDAEVWRYGQALRNMAKDNGCDRVNFLRLRNLLGEANDSEPQTEEEYLTDAPHFRSSIIERYLPQSYDPEVHIAKDPDATLTYRGYIKFLETDLASRPVEGEPKSKAQLKKIYEEIAKKMMAFAASVAQNLAGHIRLSIHASTETSKLSMALIPQLSRLFTPWHSALVRAVDGSITMSHAAQVPALTHELIFDKDDRPSYFRERSPLFNWPGMDVDFNYVYPTGIIITPRDPMSRYSLHNVHMQKVRALSEACSPVVLRGFTDTTDQHTFESKAYDAGKVAPWVFGIRQAVKDAGSNNRMANTVTSTEAMPMHYDGMFFLKKEVVDPATGTEKMVAQVPRFQYFTAVTPSPPGDGMTLFASSQLFFQHLPAGYTYEELSRLKWSCRHSSNWDNPQEDLSLVVPHPTNQKPCIRWHEPWYKWQTKFSHNEIRISNGEQHYKKLINEMLYDRRVCLYFNFEQGDILVADNVSMMHTRTSFTEGTGRELWRIHFN